MKISTRGRYALRILLDISINGNGRPVSFREVSLRQDISLKYMEQIGALLVRGGFLKSVRGAQGGYMLVGKPSDHTVGSVLRVTEGHLDPTPCLEGDAVCPRYNDCLTFPLWEKLDEAIRQVVDSTTLQDLIDGRADRQPIAIDADAPSATSGNGALRMDGFGAAGAAPGFVSSAR